MTKRLFSGEVSSVLQWCEEVSLDGLIMNFPAKVFGLFIWDFSSVPDVYTLDSLTIGGEEQLLGAIPISVFTSNPLRPVTLPIARMAARQNSLKANMPIIFPIVSAGQQIKYKASNTNITLALWGIRQVTEFDFPR